MAHEVVDQFRDFRNFLFMVWKHLTLPHPTPVQYDMAEFIQYGPRRAVLEGFRGVGKSWVCSAFVAHSLYLDPEEKFLVVSASKTRADDFSTFTKRLIYEIPILQFLIPDDRTQRTSNVAFDVGPCRPAHAASVKSVGITGQLTGSRATKIVADDIEVPANSQTQTQRDKLAEAVKEFDAIVLPGGRITYLGTPQTEMSLYNQLPARGYTTRIWPARLPTKDQREKYAGKLAPMIEEMDGEPGMPTDPKRFDNDDLDERETSYGRTGFNLQFMLDTSLSDQERYPLRMRDFIVMGLNPKMGPNKVVWGSQEVVKELPMVGFPNDRLYKPAFVSEMWEDFTGSCLFIDPSGRGKDETGWAVVKILNSMLFLTAAGGLAGGYDEKEALIPLARIAKEQEVNYILIESNFGDGMFSQLLKPVLDNEGHKCLVEEIRHTKAKEKRVCDVLEPVLNSHRLVVDEKLIKEDHARQPVVKYQLMHQLTRLTRDKGALAHDDRVEAVAGAVAYWVEQMARDPKRAAEDSEARAMHKEIEKFLQAAVGGQRRRNAWTQVRRS